jgi:hypothetical protein
MVSSWGCDAGRVLDNKNGGIDDAAANRLCHDVGDFPNLNGQSLAD